MSDSANFDPAKAMVMQARAMGIDPSTREGMIQMQAAHNARVANSRSSLAGFDPFYDTPRTAPPLDPIARRKRNAKRKAARKARKKNR